MTANDDSEREREEPAEEQCTTVSGVADRDSTIRMEVPVEVPADVFRAALDEFTAAKESGAVSAELDDFLLDRLDLNVRWDLPEIEAGGE